MIHRQTDRQTDRHVDTTFFNTMKYMSNRKEIQHVLSLKQIVVFTIKWDYFMFKAGLSFLEMLRVISVENQ